MGEVFFRLGQRGAFARLIYYYYSNNGLTSLHYKTLYITHSYYDKYYIAIYKRVAADTWLEARNTVDRRARRLDITSLP